MSNPADTRASFSKGYRAWLIFLLFAINTFNFADRQVLSTLAEAVKRDLAITDFQLGLLQGLGFALLYSILGLPIARLAERRNRGRIIAVAVSVWSIFAALCGAATSFFTLLLCRVGVGVGEAGFNPPTASLVADLWPAAKRAGVMALIALGGAAGPLIGSLGGGMIADATNWRTAFVVIAAPGIVLGLIAFLTLREPPRGMADGVAESLDDVPDIKTTFRALVAKPAFRQLLIGLAVGAAAMNGFNQFLGMFYVRFYGLTFTEVGALFGSVAAIAVTSGLLIGGFGAQWLSQRDGRWIAWACAIGLATCGPVFFLGFFQPTALGFTLFFGIGSALLFVYYAPALAMLQNLAPPRMRASAAFIGAFATGIIGLGIGPALLGLLSDTAAGMYYGAGYATQCAGTELSDACRSAQVSGLRSALMIDCAIFLWAAFHYLLAARTVREDTYRPKEPAA